MADIGRGGGVLLPVKAISARYDNASPETLRNWERSGRLPPAIRIGRKKFWRPEDIDANERRLEHESIASASTADGL